MATKKKFASNRPLGAIRSGVLRKGEGAYWNDEKFKAGGDYVSFGYPLVGAKAKPYGLDVAYNTFNGTFIVRGEDAKGKEVFWTERSKLDGTKWYDDLLELIYVPLEADIPPKREVKTRLRLVDKVS
jgi:hypothetical protein